MTSTRSTTSSTTAVARFLVHAAHRCQVKPVAVEARKATVWFETARGASAVPVLAGQITIDGCDNAVFLAAVLQLSPTRSRCSAASRLPLPLAARHGCAPCPRWQGWGVGEQPHIPVSITVVCSGEHREAGCGRGRGCVRGLGSRVTATVRNETARWWSSSGRRGKGERPVRTGGS